MAFHFLHKRSACDKYADADADADADSDADCWWRFWLLILMMNDDLSTSSWISWTTSARRLWPAFSKCHTWLTVFFCVQNLKLEFLSQNATPGNCFFSLQNPKLEFWSQLVKMPHLVCRFLCAKSQTRFDLNLSTCNQYFSTFCLKMPSQNDTLGKPFFLFCAKSQTRLLTLSSRNAINISPPLVDKLTGPPVAAWKQSFYHYLITQHCPHPHQLCHGLL